MAGGRAGGRGAKVADDARTRLVEVAAAYRAGIDDFFPAPELPRVTETAAGDGPLGTRVVDLAFPSDYTPFLPAARDFEIAENLTAHVRLWASGRGRPVIVLLHGWGAGQHWMSARAFALPYWLRHGYDVAALVLPHHGPRAGSSPGAWPSTHPVRTNEGFGQAVYEARALARWLRARGASAVGAIGMSLGGYTTATWASVAGPDDAGGLDFAVAMIPAVSMAALMWRHGETSPMRRRAAKVGITEDLLADAFSVHAPTTRPVRLPRERLAIIGGRGDRITPPEQAEMLAAHWGVEIGWFDGGHLAQVGRNEALRAVRQQLGMLPLVGREFRP